jgi:fatty acid-binding protein DegV
MLGAALDVKPLVTLEEGVLAPAGRVRGRGQAVEMLARRVGELADHCQRLAVLHGNAPDLDALLEALQEVAPGHEPLVAQLGPVVGTHTGPGALAVAWCVD